MVKLELNNYETIPGNTQNLRIGGQDHCHLQRQSDRDYA